MLILSKEYVEEHRGDTKSLYLYGQDDNGNAWTICKMNMILHGIKNARIEQGDTLLRPVHKESDGKLLRFDYVISNPPFSQDYKKEEMEYAGRFRFFCPETGKKADLMFAQHMLAVLRHEGMVATVMPHGVLFRGGTEQLIRKDFVERDVLEAVIGLPANLFYGTGIPACILVMRSDGCKPSERKGKVLFINADAEYGERRPKRYLRPEDIEKIVTTFEEFKPVPGYAVVVTKEQLAENDWNLNIRRYADNAPPPPDSKEAEATTTEFEQRALRLLESMKERIAVKILVWGPSLRSKSQIAEKRRNIYSKLKEARHHCWFSEEFSDPPPGVTLKSYELAQASEADMIVMLVEATAPGAIGEMHDFCSHRELLHKILLFYPKGMVNSYSGQGLVKDLEKGYRNVEYYTEIDITSCRVSTIALGWVQARRSYIFSHMPLSS